MKLKALIQDEVPLFQGDEIEKTVKDYFKNKDKYLHTHNLHRKPLYVFEKEILKKRASEFMQAFEMVFKDCSFYYALKCNNHPQVLKAALDSGFGVDVSSGVELKTALDGGAQNIVFSGPGKNQDEIELAVENTDKVIILADSFSETGKIDAVSRVLNKKIRIGIRLTTNTEPLWRKFGIPLERLPEFWKLVKTKPNIQFHGLQFHTSWNLTPDAQIDFIKKLGPFLKAMPEDFKRSVKILDIGGGYWPPQGEWLLRSPEPPSVARLQAEKNYFIKPATPIRSFAEQISRALKEHVLQELNCEICLESGRWLCNDAVQLLMSVIDKKSEDIVITDAGTNAIGWERFEQDYFPILNLSKPEFKERSCNILGSLCTPHDVWGRSYWGSEICEGDILLIPMQGAYTYSLKQNFIKTPPDFVTV